MCSKKTEDLNIHVFNMITRINESNILTKHISCKCKYKFDGRNCYSNQKWNNDKCQCECIFGILLHVVVKMVNI